MHVKNMLSCIQKGVKITMNVLLKMWFDIKIISVEFMWSNILVKWLSISVEDYKIITYLQA